MRVSWVDGRKTKSKLSRKLILLLYYNSVLSTGLIMWIGHRKEIRKLTSDSPSSDGYERSKLVNRFADVTGITACTCKLVNHTWTESARDRVFHQSGRTTVLEEAMTSRFYCFARKSQKLSAWKYRLSKKLDSRFDRSTSQNFKASLSNVPWARVGNFWQRESIKSLSFWKGLRRSRRHFDRQRM